MKRKAEVILSSKDGRRNIAIDQDNHESIMKFLKEKNQKNQFAERRLIKKVAGYEYEIE